MEGNLIFKYSTMFGGKSNDLIGNYENLRHGGKTIAVYKPAQDTRELEFVVKSRAHERSIPARMLMPDGDHVIPEEEFVFVDEGQFLTAANIEWLDALKEHGKRVIVWGLMRNYLGEVFDGTLRLLAITDSIIELKTVCGEAGCVRKATHHVLRLNGDVVKDGSGVHVGDTEYKSVCHGHYREAMR